jgi:hypothetical protein
LPETKRKIPQRIELQCKYLYFLTCESGYCCFLVYEPFAPEIKSYCCPNYLLILMIVETQLIGNKEIHLHYKINNCYE